MKNYPPEFNADAVALYESRPEATIRAVATDLGINPETLRNWVRAAGASCPRGRRNQPSRRRRWKRGTRPCGRRSASLRRNARFCGRPPSISPGRRVGSDDSGPGTSSLCSVLICPQAAQGRGLAEVVTQTSGR
ncbi:transposase [Streptomyces sp. NPDC005017]|uniref:transposase n=1 Tax=Streptomyces sp. NPDC005017 TaxID=3364706 RepID=UPI0036A881C2